MQLRSGAIFALLMVLLLGGNARAADVTSKAALRSMQAEFVCKAIVPALPAGTKRVALWVPLPSDSEWQQVENVTVEGVTKYKITKEKRYDNRMVYVDLKALATPINVTVRYTVTRKELRILAEAPRHPQKESDAFLKMNLMGEKSLPIGGRFLKLSQDVTAGRTTQLEKARAIYEHILGTMKYDYKSESPKLGEGDAEFMCDYRQGDCTDLHSYFISMARTQGIPVLHEYGFGIGGVPLPSPLPREAKITSYHCYACIYQPDYGWIPVDASDGIRWGDHNRPDLRDYQFGNLVLERNAVAISRGRNLVLSPPQHGEPVNKFIYPYAEADGKTIKVEMDLARRLLKAPKAADAPTG
jgi:transglutaminase-like putative cysteine protease